MKTTYRFIMTMTLAAFLCSGNLMAQQTQKPQPKKPTPEERMEFAIKQTERQLMLDDETSAKFAPLYKEYLEELQANCPKNKPKALKKGEKPQMKDCTDDEILQKMESCIANQRKRLDIQEKYMKKFKEILTPRQLEKVMSPRCHRMHRPNMGKNEKRGFRNMRQRPMGTCPGQQPMNFCPFQQPAPANAQAE